MPNPQAKLTDEEQYQVCQWYAQFRTPTQIQRLLKETYAKELSLKVIWAYAHQQKKWKPLIERLRQEWALGVMDIPMAHKRARLEKLVTLLQRAERNEKATEFTRIEQCYRILREMREEMEAGKAEFTNVYMTTIHTYSDEEIVRQRDAVLERLKLLGRRDGTRHDREIEIAPSAGKTEDADLDGAEGAPIREVPEVPEGEVGVVLDARDERAPEEVHGSGIEPQASGEEDPHGDVGDPTPALCPEAGEPRPQAVQGLMSRLRFWRKRDG